MSESAKRIDCRRCRHYFITWEPVHPNGCRAMRFKSRQMPSIDVAASSGLPCQAFEEKTPDRSRNKGMPA